MAVKTPSIVYETTDTFAQLIADLNSNAGYYDSDLRYLDSAVGDRNLLTTTATASVGEGTIDLVAAINELDSDLHGSGGGTFKDLTNTDAGTVVAAINEIEALFDASASTITNSITVQGSITIPAAGTGSITSSEISATTVHGAIDEVNERIPNVYDRTGTLLNP